MIVLEGLLKTELMIKLKASPEHHLKPEGGLPSSLTSRTGSPVRGVKRPVSLCPQGTCKAMLGEKDGQGSAHCLLDTLLSFCSKYGLLINESNLKYFNFGKEQSQAGTRVI